MVVPITRFICIAALSLWAAICVKAETVVVFQEPVSSERVSEALSGSGEKTPQPVSVAPGVSPAYGRIYVFPEGLNSRQEAALRAHGAEWIGPNGFIPIDPLTREKPSSAAPHAVSPQNQPDDLLFPNQEALKALRVPQAWSRSTGSNILIAIVDTGVDLDHPDLRNNLYRNADELHGLPGVDDDGNGYVDDVGGYDFTDAPLFPGVGDYLERDPDPSDENGHGTAVAGVAAAVGNNHVGIIGVAPDAAILPVRAGLNTRMPFLPAILQEDDAAAAIIYAADQGAHIINCSWGDVVESPIVRAAVRYAQEQRALVVGSAGNISGNVPNYPSGHLGVLGVGATDFTDTPTSFTTFGYDLDVMAPGSGVLAPVLNGGWDHFSGTSLSAPLTSGVAALVWSESWFWTAEQVAWRIMETARRQDGWTEARGWGAVDAARAVARFEEAPYAVEIRGIDRAEEDSPWRIRGEVLGADVVSWALSALTVDGARQQILAGPESLPRSGILGEWSPALEDTAEWVLKLEADLGRRGLRERQVRLLPRAPLDHAGIETEFQVGREGWDLVVTWDSNSPHQGAAHLSGMWWREEPAVGTHHALRLPRVSSRAHDLTLLGRLPRGRTYHLLDRRTDLSPPPEPHISVLHPPLLLAPGTMMSAQSDVDADGNPELIFETAVDTDGYEYGRIRFAEITPALDATTGEGLTADYRGIPLSVGDTDGDGRLELMVFRLGNWSVYEAAFPGGYPTQEIFSSSSEFPIGLLEPEGVMLTVQGANLRVWIPGGDTFILSGEISGGERGLAGQSAWGDVDGDGKTEVFIRNLESKVAVFRVESDGTGAFLDLSEEPIVGIDMALVGNALITAHQSPGAVRHEGDMELLSTRLTQWTWDREFHQVDDLAFGGNHVRSLVPLGDALWVGRPGRWDKVDVGEGLTWADGFEEAEPEAFDVNGAAVQSETSRGILVGAFFSDHTQLYRLDHQPQLQGNPPTVASFRTRETGILVQVSFSQDACSLTTVIRHSPTESTEIPFEDHGFTDPVDFGETVTYEFLYAECASQNLELTGAPLELPVIAWDSPVSFSVDWSAPVPLEQPGRVRIHSRGEWLEPLAWSQQNHGDRFVITVPDGVTPVDSVRFVRFWDANGLPVGGTVSSSYLLPSQPSPESAALRTASYNPDLQRIEIAVSGFGDCPEGLDFLLSPGGRPYRAALENPESEMAYITLDQPLAPGAYELQYVGGCAAVPRASRILRFVVGLVAYPNPVGVDRELTVANLPSNARVTLFDASGQRVRQWTPAGESRFDLSGLASGLYVLRIEGPGLEAVLEKIAVH